MFGVSFVKSFQKPKIITLKTVNDKIEAVIFIVAWLGCVALGTWIGISFARML